MGQLLEQATEARDYISNPENWIRCQLSDHEDDGGNSIEGAKLAKRVCSLGALVKFDLATEQDIVYMFTSPVCLLADQVAAERWEAKAIRDDEILEFPFTTYNDAHNHSEVMELWDDLLVAVKEYENG